MSEGRTPKIDYESDIEGKDNIDEALKDDLVWNDSFSDRSSFLEPANMRTGSVVIFGDGEKARNPRDFYKEEKSLVKTKTAIKDDVEFKEFCYSPEYRLSLLYSESESSEEKERRFLKFERYAHQVYPRSYLKRINELLYKDKNESENRVFQSLLRLPLVTEVNFDSKKVLNEVREIIKVNPSMEGLCEAFISFFNRLAKIGEIKLKDLENRGHLKNLPRLTFLLVGKKGTGKSWIGRTLADILGFPSVYIDCANTDFLNLVGSSYQWGNSGEGILARELIKEGTFPLIVIFDEIDKAGEANSHALIDTISHIIDPLKVFKDEFLDIPLLHYRLSIFILTANNIKAIPDYFLSRSILYFINPISPELRYKVVLKSISELLEELDLPKRELIPLFEDEVTIKKAVKLIDDLNLDIREIKLRCEVALLRYQFHYEISGNKGVKFIDILFEELEGTLGSKELPTSIGKIKLGFV